MFANSKVYFWRYLQMLRSVALIYSLTKKSTKMEIDLMIMVYCRTWTWFEEIQEAVGPDIAVGAACAFFDAAPLWQRMGVMAVYGTLMHL